MNIKLFDHSIALPLPSPPSSFRKLVRAGNKHLFVPAVILILMMLGLVIAVFAAHDLLAYRGILPPLPRAPLVTGVTEIFAVLWLFEMAERFTKSRWQDFRPLLPRWAKFLLVTVLCLLLLWVTNTHS
jgi:hypothetical protein